MTHRTLQARLERLAQRLPTVTEPAPAPGPLTPRERCHAVLALYDDIADRVEDAAERGALQAAIEQVRHQLEQADAPDVRPFLDTQCQAVLQETQRRAADAPRSRP